MSTRDEIIAGLRELVEFLAANPEVPLQPWVARISQPVDRGADDEAGMAELRRVAQILGVEVDNKNGGDSHWYATRSFGPAMYEATYVLRAHMEQYDEEQRWLDERRAGGDSDV